MTRLHHQITPERFDAVLFDLDGVLTDTGSTHAACWKKTFDAFLQERTDKTGEPFHPFEIATDYRLHVDGKPRFDGVRDFLHARDIHLPQGAVDAPPGNETVCSLGNRKNDLLISALASGTIEVYEDSVALVHHLREAGIKTAVVSSSRNCEAVLAAAHIADLFDVRIDGEVATRLHLAGKPAPDTYLAAAAQLNVSPDRAVVVEDAISGVQAGRAGGFGLVVGVDRNGNADALRDNGADIVVTDLSHLLE